ncbi:hypothetical protein RvY_18999-1 [Ramazzottius varieornatus]|uniref:HMG box domain-containing protein n=1 Tax=Ramazzottius varieornatus TaxID=947166 RepID=A0A1D1W805_RAMVA|nr:hypothetical protein RvY_18999-1 [Ramazzottius varieornatus]
MEEKEKKQQEAMQKKLERDKLLEEEMNSIKGAKNAAPAKVTRAHIDATLERERLAKIAAAVRTKEENAGTKPPFELDEDAPLHENVNRLVAEEGAARSVDEALAALSTKDEDGGDKHPEKRVRGAYIVFEERELPRLKEEYPNFRLSQLKQMLKKEWQKSPENPFNQSTQTYNSARR